MNKQLTITIVIPVFNESGHLKRCLESVKNQSHLPTQVIVVDNNSTDDSVKIAKKYKFATIIQEKKQGIVYARNSGFNAVKTDLIGRIDADSVLHSDWVYHALMFYEDAEHMKHALTGGGYFYNIRTPRLNGWLQGQLAFRTNRLIAGHYILWGSNMVIPTSMWNDIKSSSCLRNDIHEDMDLAIHAHRQGYVITYHESLRVGVKLKRVWEDRWEQRKHLARWPRTLRVHGYKLWWMGSLGNVFLSVVGEPYIFVSELGARLLNRPRLPK